MNVASVKARHPVADDPPKVLAQVAAFEARAACGRRLRRAPKRGRSVQLVLSPSVGPPPGASTSRRIAGCNFSLEVHPTLGAVTSRAPRFSAISEAWMGFEPTYDGFANRCLTTWLPRHPERSPRGSRSARATEARRASPARRRAATLSGRSFLRQRRPTRNRRGLATPPLRSPRRPPARPLLFSATALRAPLFKRSPRPRPNLGRSRRSPVPARAGSRPTGAGRRPAAGRDQLPLPPRYAGGPKRVIHSK